MEERVRGEEVLNHGFHGFHGLSQGNKRQGNIPLTIIPLTSFPGWQQVEKPLSPLPALRCGERELCLRSSFQSFASGLREARRPASLVLPCREDGKKCIRARRK